MADGFADDDIALIRAPSGLTGNLSAIGAIRFGPLWVTLSPGGFVGKSADVIAAWRFAV